VEPVGPELVMKLLSRLEEVRPIHVLVMLTIIVYDIPEKLLNFVTDSPPCGPHQGADIRSNEYRFYGGDPAGIPFDAGLLITTITGGLEERNYNLEDKCAIFNYPDALTIEFSDGSPTQYW
jgi:hypothetical protein